MNATVIRLGLRALFSGRRGVLLLLLPAALLALAVVVRLLTGSALGVDPIVNTLGYTLVLPLVALLATTGVLSSEIDDGSILYLLATPVSRYHIAASKALVAVGTTAVLGAGTLVVGGLILDPGSPGQALAWGCGGLVAGTTYCAVFLFLGTLLRQAVIAGLLYVLVWESSLGLLLPGIRWLSVGAWGRQVVESLGTPAVDGAGVGIAYALLAAGVVTVGLVWWSGHRLRSFAMADDV